MPSEPILVLMKSYLGDAVMATPILRALAGHDVTVRAPKVIHELVKSPEHPYKPLDSTKLHGLMNLMKEARTLRSHGFRSVILVNRSFRTAVLARLAKIPIRIGHATEGRSLLLTDVVPYDPGATEVRSYADLVEHGGIPVPTLEPRLWVSEAERVAGGQALGGVRIAIQPGARYPEKTVPLKAWLDLTARLKSAGMPYAVVGGPDEVEAAKSFEDGLNLVGKLSMRESMGVAANLQVLVGGDTGFMHVAAALDCPTVTVFGPTNSAKWGRPEGHRQAIEAQDRLITNVTGDDLWQAVVRALPEP